MTREPDEAAKPVSMSKSAPGADPAPTRPWTATAAAAAIALSALAALAGSLVLLGQRHWLTTQLIKDNKKTFSSAVASASSSAAKNHGDVASAVSSASASATSRYPTTAPAVHHTVSQQQSGAVIMSAVLVLAMAFLAFGVYRGRHWSRWGVVVFWGLATLTGTFAGLTFLFAVSSSLPAGVKAMTFTSSASLVAAVILVNLKMSTEYFALSRPARAAGAPARRGLFMPRMPAEPAKQPPASRAKTAQASSSDAQAQKQRAKTRAAANAESIARGAELARSRAKASKSRRTES